MRRHFLPANSPDSATLRFSGYFHSISPHLDFLFNLSFLRNSFSLDWMLCYISPNRIWGDIASFPGYESLKKKAHINSLLRMWGGIWRLCCFKMSRHFLHMFGSVLKSTPGGPRGWEGICTLEFFHSDTLRGLKVIFFPSKLYCYVEETNRLTLLHNQHFFFHHQTMLFVWTTICIWF